MTDAAKQVASYTQKDGRAQWTLIRVGSTFRVERKSLERTHTTEHVNLNSAIARYARNMVKDAAVARPTTKRKRVRKAA